MLPTDLRWRPEMEIGVEAIDSDHKALFHYVREFMESLENGEDALVFDGIFASLADYASYHFGREEAVMEACGYPNLAGHQSQHAALAARVFEARDRYMLSRGKELTEELRAFLLSWLGDHILKADLDIRRHVPGKEGAIALALAALPGSITAR